MTNEQEIANFLIVWLGSTAIVTMLVIAMGEFMKQLRENRRNKSRRHATKINNYTKRS